jgi:NitT/TauT family transport system substrate-binding protein
LIVKTTLLEEHKAVVDEFIRLFSDSIEWAKANPGELTAYAQELEIGIPAAAVTDSMARANQRFVKASDSVAEYESFLNAIFAFDPNVIGGRLPDEGFFIQ